MRISIRFFFKRATPLAIHLFRKTSFLLDETATARGLAPAWGKGQLESATFDVFSAHFVRARR